MTWKQERSLRAIGQVALRVVGCIVGIPVGGYVGLLASTLIGPPDRASEVDMYLAAPLFGLVLGSVAGAYAGWYFIQWIQELLAKRHTA